MVGNHVAAFSSLDCTSSSCSPSAPASLERPSFCTGSNEWITSRAISLSTTPANGRDITPETPLNVPPARGSTDLGAASARAASTYCRQMRPRHVAVV